MVDTYSKALVGYERIQEVLDTDKEVKDLPRAIQAPRFKGRIELNMSTFINECNRLFTTVTSLGMVFGRDLSSFRSSKVQCR